MYVIVNIYISTTNNDTVPISSCSTVGMGGGGR